MAVTSALTSAGSARLGRRQVLRPPWTDEAKIKTNCTSCGDCIRACPEAILIPGPASTPEINFAAGECTFCGACAEVCTEKVFRSTESPAWDNVAAITSNCLLGRGVECRSCTDICETGALKFDLRVRPSGKIELDAEACTGCGACVSACPAAAIEIRPELNRSVSNEHLRMSFARHA